ncbi:MAG: hypothetical protein E6Q76_19605 [Rhizobium sp.]|nr:MAG: hypothetical protein E6Q76_19605 [Rhizobium sp.]
MASLTKAIADTYAGIAAGEFPASTRPPAFFTRSPQTTPAGAQQRLPYVVFSLTSDKTDLTFEDDGIEASTLTVIAYAESRPASAPPQTDGQADANATIAAVRARFDNTATLDNFSEGTLLSCLPTRPPEPKQEPHLSKDGYTVFSTRMVWQIEVQTA